MLHEPLLKFFIGLIVFVGFLTFFAHPANADTGIVAFGSADTHTAGDDYEVFFNSQVIEIIPYAGQGQYQSVEITTLTSGDTVGVRATRCNTNGTHCIYSATVEITYDPLDFPGGGPSSGISLGAPTDMRLLVQGL